MNQQEAVHQCIQLEQYAPNYGFHIALTGGCLYKSGERKDCDVVLYRIRQNLDPDLEGFFNELVTMGWTWGKTHGWVQKMVSPSGQNFDFFYPEFIDKATFWERLKAIFSSEAQGGY